MDHSYFKDRISAYHDGELKHEEEYLITEHLKTCAECRQLLKELEAFDRMVERQSGLKDDEYWERSAQKIEQALGGEVKTEVVDIKRSSWSGLRWKLAGVAASAAVIAFIALYETDITDQVNLEIKPMAKAERPQQVEPEDSFPPEGFLAGEHEESELESVSVTDTGVPSAVDHIAGIPRPAAEEEAVVSREMTVTKSAPSEVVPEVKKDADVLDQSPAEDFPYLQHVADPALYEGGRVTASDESSRRDALVGLVGKTADTDGVKIIPEPPVVIRGGRAAEFGDSGDTELSLVQWRVKRDSLERVLADGDWERPMSNEMELTAKAKLLDKKARAAMIDSVSSEITEQDPQLLLLESYYQVGLVTDDKVEFERSVESLREYLDREDSVYKLNAAWFLQRLEERKW